jgi:phosphoesterase RecJ-like protein
MEISPKQQIVELVKSSNRILLVSHVNPDGDALGSILALYIALTKLGKKVTAVVSDIIPETYKFLPQVDMVGSNFSGIRDFIISVDLTNADVEKLGYKKDKTENRLNIVLTPRSGSLSPEDVNFSYGKNKFDLIFVLDCPDFDRIGKVYDENTDLFYETPIINIDHHPVNDHFGKINWVEITATSTCEILVSLIESLSREQQLLDADVATCLLTGITTDTASFQNTNTTPKSLTIAAQMVAAGARQQEIIQKIYKTKQLTTLKLWGVILSRVIQETEGFVWSYVGEDDFSAVGASPDEVRGVIDELLKTVPGVDFALLLVEKGSLVHGSLRATKKTVNVSEVAKLFDGGGHEQASAFQIKDVTLAGVQDEIIKKIKLHQEKINSNIPDNTGELITEDEIGIQ